MDRRKFMLLSAALGSAIVLKSIVSLDTANHTFALTNIESLKQIMNDDTLQSIGVEYLRRRPQENIEKTLLSIIPYDSLEKDLIQKELDKIIEDDFKRNRTLTIEGWVVSETEARQCALLTTLII